MSNESGSVTDAGDPSTAQNGTRLRILSAHFGFTALLSILFLTFLDNTVISAVLANVQSALHEGVSDLQWVVGAYALTFASLMLISGSLSDNFGRKKVMLAGVAFSVRARSCAPWPTRQRCWWSDASSWAWARPHRSRARCP